MKIGLTGLTNSGKTTIFNALTNGEFPVSAYSEANAEPHQSIISIPDERITKLTSIYNPKKTVHATIELVDFPGASIDSDSGPSSLSADTIRQIKNMDAIGIVIRNYDDDLLGNSDITGDFNTITGDLLLSDLMIVENRLDRIAWQYQRGQKTQELENEESVLKRIHRALDENGSLDGLELVASEEKLIRGFQFLSLKPKLVIVNSDETKFEDSQSLIASLPDSIPLIEFAGKFEMELSQIEDEEELQMFMGDIGIKSSARDRLARSAYDILGYISFFTVGEDEVRAWNIVKGDNAVVAAGTIHSDLARGFIRAECFTYTDLMEFGDEKTVRRKGKFRLEGKEYLVQDGDILNIRFNV